MAALGLHCCTQAFSNCSEQGFSLWWLLLLRSTGSTACGLSSSRAQLLRSMWDLPAPGNPCTTRRIPNHRTTREAPGSVLKGLRQRSFFPLEKSCLSLLSSSLCSQNPHAFFPLASYRILPSFLSLPLPTTFVHLPSLVTLKLVSEC